MVAAVCSAQQEQFNLTIPSTIGSVVVTNAEGLKQLNGSLLHLFQWTLDGVRSFCQELTVPLH